MARAALAPLPGDVGRAALAALHEELVLPGKPGLVSPGDAGAHGDMDAGTFFRSLLALRGAFASLARAGAEGAPFAALRDLAVAAEARMLRATGGVNTHRGALFALGLLSAAAGREGAAGRTPGDDLGAAVRRHFGAALRDLPPDPRSHGSRAARHHGLPGARDEALAGFPHLFGVALPALRSCLARGAGRRRAALQALYALVAALPDTNLLHRGGAGGLAFAQAAARRFLDAGGVLSPGWQLRARAVHRAFVDRGLSPGGSADMLAGALFVERLGEQGNPGRSR
ncbi:MAG: triphosphoribosyl-dephospho-CoA synthase [Deltaproteobacteria bacterium]|nr:triphosphoribosyl-dephospho-CoA synthase [Deltaproteobacteria bacterium]